MVMLSGSEDSWQYWPGDEGERTLSFGYMTVTLVNERAGSATSRESSKYPTQRYCSFLYHQDSNLMSQAREEVHLTHFSYNEWPGSSDDTGLVPSSTHGILGLVEHALAHQEEASLTGPIAVHCR